MTERTTFVDANFLLDRAPSATPFGTVIIAGRAGTGELGLVAINPIIHAALGPANQTSTSAAMLWSPTYLSLARNTRRYRTCFPGVDPIGPRE